MKLSRCLCAVLACACFSIAAFASTPTPAPDVPQDVYQAASEAAAKHHMKVRLFRREQRGDAKSNEISTSNDVEALKVKLEAAKAFLGANGIGTTSGGTDLTEQFGDKGKLAIRIICAIAGLVFIGYGAWIFKANADVKDAVIAAGIGGTLVAIAIYPPLLIVGLLAGLVLLAVRFGPAVIKAASHEPLRAYVGAEGAIQDDINAAAKMAPSSDPGKDVVSFPNQAAYLQSVLATLKAKLASQQSGSDASVIASVKKADGVSA